MKTRKFVVTVTAALVALSLSATAFAASKTQSRSGLRTQIKTMINTGTCVK